MEKTRHSFAPGVTQSALCPGQNCVNYFCGQLTHRIERNLPSEVQTSVFLDVGLPRQLEACPMRIGAPEMREPRCHLLSLSTMLNVSLREGKVGHARFRLSIMLQINSSPYERSRPTSPLDFRALQPTKPNTEPCAATNSLVESMKSPKGPKPTAKPTT